jgi:CheY-like chemotaxis protein
MVWKMEHEPPTTSATTVSGEATSPSPRTVLVADEDRGQRETVAEALRGRGYHVLEASNSFELLDYLSELVADTAPVDRPELIVCDERMPGVHTLSALTALRPSRRSPIVVLTTANTDLETTNRSGRLGAASVFVRPVDVDALISFCKVVAPP